MLNFFKNLFKRKKKSSQKINEEYYTIDSTIGEINAKNNDLSVCYALEAETERKLGNLDIALKNIKKALKINPFNDMYYYTQALIYKSLDNNNEYISNIKKAYELNPEYLKYKNILDSSVS